jgi:hypothetical protein
VEKDGTAMEASEDDRSNPSEERDLQAVALIPVFGFPVARHDGNVL